MKAYIVTSGSYSDYNIEAVFSTEEKAKEFINNRGDDDFNEIEEYEMDKPCEKEKSIYWCTVNIKTGEIFVESRWTSMDIYKDDIDTFCFDESLNDRKMSFYIETDTLEKAKKITAERWQQVRALKDVCFPRLYEKCVVTKNKIFLSATRYATIHYPVYNFVTKQIVLKEGECLVDNMEKEIEELKRQGFIVDFW